uniref:RNase H type-1 domain-containing protein n=1 Tax=Chenopodium quinoa TaxID=63459 RepID=A0A803MBH2_CHEQI
MSNENEREFRIRGGAGSIRVSTGEGLVLSREKWVHQADWRGKLLAVSVRQESAIESVKLAGALAPRIGLRLAKRLGFKHIELECDALEGVLLCWFV